jgi:hypothetical protein
MKTIDRHTMDVCLNYVNTRGHDAHYRERTWNYLVAAGLAGAGRSEYVDASANGVVVDYALQYLLKGSLKSPGHAAKKTAENLSGYENFLISTSGIPVIDAGKLEDSLWAHIEDKVINRLPSRMPSIVIGGVADMFHLGKRGEAELRKRVEARVGPLVDEP